MTINGSKTGSLNSKKTEVAAIVILIVFALSLIWLAQNAKTETDIIWMRLMVLYKGLEALAFAAAGVLLGTRVQRAQVVSAEARANALQGEIIGATQEAADANARGRSLRTAIESTVAKRSAFENDDSGEAKTALINLAQKLFPED